MSLRKSDIIQTLSTLVLYCVFTENTLLFPAVLFTSVIYANQKKMINSEMTIFLIHLLSSCFMLYSAESQRTERISWSIIICQGWAIGLQTDYEGRIYSIIGKIVTIVWLSLLSNFDLLSPNFIFLVPILVSKIYKKNKEEANDDNSIIVTDTHTENASSLFSLPFICQFEPIEKSPPVTALFYNSNGGVYRYQDKQYKVISLINGPRVYLQVDIILE